MIHSTIETPAEETESVVSITAKTLSAALDFMAKRILERRNTVPILSCVVLERSEAGLLSIYGTDLDMSASIELDAHSEGEPFGFAVDGFAFRDVLKKLPKGAHVRLIRDGERMNVQSGRARYSLAIKPRDDMPRIAEPVPETATAFDLYAPPFAADIKALTPAIGTEEIRYYLCGILATVTAGGLSLVATNGATLAVSTRDLPNGAETLTDSIIPAKAIKALAHVLKKPAGSIAVTIGDVEGNSIGRAVFQAGEIRIVSKLVDGTFPPTWESMFIQADEAELQTVAMPELEPRLSPAILNALEKGAGVRLDAAIAVELDVPVAVLSSPLLPHYRAVTVLARVEEPKGFCYYTSDAAMARATEYLEGLRQRYELPDVIQPAESETSWRPAKPEGKADGRLIIQDGRAVGMTFGESYGQEEIWETRLNYATFTEERVITQAGGYRYPDGAYSVFVPVPADCPIVATVSITVDGVETPVRQNDAGAIEFSAAAVAIMCGPVEDMVHVPIAERFFHRGSVMQGFAAPAQLKTKDGKRMRNMTDREVMDAHCADPAGTLALLQPVATAEGNMAGEAIAAFAMAIAGNGVTEFVAPPVTAIIEETPAVETAPEAAIAAPAISAPDAPETALAAPAIEPGTAFEAWAATIDARIGALMERMTAFEAPAAAKPEAVTIAPAPAFQRDSTREKRLRIVRRYLAMRRQRDALEAKRMHQVEGYSARVAELEARCTELNARALAAESAINDGELMEGNEELMARNAELETRAMNADKRAESLEFSHAEMAARLAVAELAANEAAAVWQPLIDSKQARIVELENELLFTKSSGRIKMLEPMRATAVPALRVVGG